MELNDLAKLIKSRRSIRDWLDKNVPEQLLQQAVELATWAPNGGNAQGWYFYIILDKSIIKSIANACQEVTNYIASLRETTAPLSERGKMTPPRANPFLSGKAPAIIAVATKRSENLTPMDEILAAREKSDVRASRIRQSMTRFDGSSQSASAAIAYLLLVLHQMGLGAVWMTGPLQAKTEIEDILNIHAGMDLVALIPVGYPAETPVKDRKPVREVSEVVR